MGIELDTFFLTAPFATDELKANVEALRERLHKLEGEYVNAHTAYTNVMADLQKMEEKVNFARNQLEKNLAIFEPPQPGDVEKAFEALEQGALNPLSDASLYGGAAGTLVWAIGAGGKALKLRRLARFQSLGKAAKAGRTARWAKVAKLGKASVYLSGVVFLVEAGLRMRSASEINAHFKQKAGEIKAQIAKAEAEVADILSVVAEAETMRDTLLADSGYESIAQYVQGLNESIAELGRQRGNLGSARRMLMAGMPVDDVETFVPGLPREALAALAQRLAVERALVDGAGLEQAAAQSGVAPVQAKGIARLHEARMALLDGQGIDEVTQASGLSRAVVEGEEEMLDADLRLAWSLLEKNTPPETIAGRCLFSVDRLRAFEQEHDAKELLFTKTAVEQVAAQLEAAPDQVRDWQDQLAAALDTARVLLDSGGPAPRLDDIAADLRIPLASLRSMTT